MNNRLNSLLSMLKNEPEDSFLLYGVALEYLSLNNYENAENYLSMLLKKDPSYVPAYMQFARLKENQNEIEEAKKYYREGIEKAKKTGDKHAAKEMEDFLDDLG